MTCFSNTCVTENTPSKNACAQRARQSAWSQELAHRLLQHQPMKCALRSVPGLLLVLAFGVACNGDCDDRCESDYQDCVAKALGDTSKENLCEGKRDQCSSSCLYEPTDANEGRH